MAKNYASTAAVAAPEVVSEAVEETSVAVSTAADVTAELPVVSETEVVEEMKSSKLTDRLPKFAFGGKEKPGAPITQVDESFIRNIQEPEVVETTTVSESDEVVLSSAIVMTGAAKIGWLLIGMFGGVFGIVGTFLVTKNTAICKKSMIWAVMGMAVTILLGILLIGAITSVMMSSVSALSGFSNPEYYEIANSAATSGIV